MTEHFWESLISLVIEHFDEENLTLWEIIGKCWEKPMFIFRFSAKNYWKSPIKCPAVIYIIFSIIIYLFIFFSADRYNFLQNWF